MAFVGCSGIATTEAAPCVSLGVAGELLLSAEPAEYEEEAELLVYRSAGKAPAAEEEDEATVLRLLPVIVTGLEAGISAACFA